MKYNQLGTSTLKVSEVSFGSMSLEKDFVTSKSLIHSAIDKGVNYFDTADIYQNGQNEIMVGKALKGKRNEVLIATKVGNQLRDDGNGWDWNPSKSYILKSVNESLKRLQTDHIDLYQLHGGTINDPIDDTIEAFEILKQQGKIRYYGISSIRPNVIRQYIKRSNLVSVMMQYSLLDRRPEESCLNLLLKNNIGVMARGAIARGLLAGKPAIDYLDYSTLEVDKAIKTLQKVSGNKRKIAQSAIRYVLQNPAITSAVMGTRTKEQLEESLNTLNIKPFSSKQMEVLQEWNTPNLYSNHR